MAGVIVSPVSMLDLISEIVAIPVNAGVFKQDCADLIRRVSLLTYFVEEIRDSKPIDSTTLPSSGNDWFLYLMIGLHDAKRLLKARHSSDIRASNPKRICCEFQSVTWKLEKALSNIPYDLYHISDETRELMELVRSQLRRATKKYESLHSMKLSGGLYEPMRRDASNCVKTKVDVDKLENNSETLHFSEEEKQDTTPLRKSSSVSLACYLSKDADNQRLDKVVTKNTDELTIPKDFLCPVSLELMKDPVIVATGQTYERAYIQRWIDCRNVTCPKTQQRLENFTLTPNYVLRSLIFRWCTEHNIELPTTGYVNFGIKDGDKYMIRTLVRRLSSRFTEGRRNAVSDLRSLSERSVENCMLIREAGAIPVLVKLLTSEDVATQEKAMGCVLDLSIHEENKELVMFAGAVTPVVQILRAGSMEARENAAVTLFSLALVDENKIIIGGSAAIPALVDLLENGSPNGKKYAATALHQLCIYQGNRVRAVRAGILTNLFKMLNDSSSHDKALRILSVLVSNQDAKSAILDENILLALKSILQKDQAKDRENAAALLLFLCKKDTEKLISIAKLGVAVPLMDLSKNGTERGKSKAKSLLELLRKACQ